MSYRTPSPPGLGATTAADTCTSCGRWPLTSTRLPKGIDLKATDIALSAEHSSGNRSAVPMGGAPGAAFLSTGCGSCCAQRRNRSGPTEAAVQDLGGR